MHLFNSILLVAHIAGGLLALIVGPLAMLTRKGGKWHARWGRIYYWTMIEVVATAAVMSVTRRYVFFLVTVTVLSFYNTFTGVRCLHQKGRVAGNARGRWPDWIVTGLVAAVGLAAIYSGIPYISKNPAFAAVRLVFGTAILLTAGRDVWRYLKPSPDPKWWLYYHIERMIGSYMGVTTAFAVNQLSPRVPPHAQIFIWLGPTLAFIPVIILWQAYYRRKTSNHIRPARVAATA